MQVFNTYNITPLYLSEYLFKCIHFIPGIKNIEVVICIYVATHNRLSGELGSIRPGQETPWSTGGCDDP